MEELHAWEAFYVIVGAAVGALIGLQFVAITIVADRMRSPGADAGAAFATPNIVHFCSVLLVSGIIAAPWGTMTGPAIAWGLVGFAGALYTAIVARRIRLVEYQPEMEDWAFHCIFPITAYAGLAVSSLFADSKTQEALFVVGGSALLLLFSGIHNSWDAVTWQVFNNAPEDGPIGEDAATPENE